MNLDWSLFHVINQFAGHSPALDAVGIFFAADAFLLYGVLVAVLWFWPAEAETRHRHQKSVINAGLALIGALVTAYLVGVFFYRARPFVVHSVTQLFVYPADASFPSEHATLALAMTVALWRVLGRMRWFLVAWGILIAVARVFVGVHYPTDVLAGALLGAVWGLLTLIFASKLAQLEAPLLERLARWHLA